MLSEANNAFACDLYRQLAAQHENDNLFFSPYSMFSVLAMCAEGALNNTADELGRALRFPADLRKAVQSELDSPWNLEPLHAGLAELNSLMRCDDDEASPDEIRESRMKLWHLSKRAEEAKAKGNAQAQKEIAEQTRLEEVRFKRIYARTDPNVLRTANSLWVEQTLPLRSEFVKVIESHYQKNGVRPIDFKHDAERATSLINAWVEKHTEGKITELVPSDFLDSLTRLIVANAVYFKGRWDSPFDEAMTESMVFTMSDGSGQETPMMIAEEMSSTSYAAFNGDGSIFPTPSRIPIESSVEPRVAMRRGTSGGPEYPDADGFAMLELLYENYRLSMVLIAPNRHDALVEVEAKLSGASLANWADQLVSRPVHVLLPRFKFHTEYPMSDPLRALGIRSAFTDPSRDGGADFRGMTLSPEPDNQLAIAEVFHKAFVDVNERGTEAAAATAAVQASGVFRVPMTVPFTPVFKADRPFICIIRERPTNTILFVGRVMDPT